MSVTWSWYLGRNTQVAAGLETAAPKVPDSFMQRIIKLIPVGAVGLYTAAAAFAASPSDLTIRFWVLLLVFVAGLVFVWLEMTNTRVGRGLSWGDPTGRVQISVALSAFAVWVFAQGGWFALLKIGTISYEPWMGGLAAVLFAAFAIFFAPSE